jgi:hypothetical protein
MAGVVIFNPGSSGAPTAACTITINFARAFSNTAVQPLKVLLTPNDSSTASLFLWASPAVGPNSGSMTIGMSNPPVLTVGYSFSYLVIE